MASDGAGATVRAALEAAVAAARASAAALDALDAKAGDGDVGVTLRQAMEAGERDLDDLAAMAPADLVREGRRTLGTSAAATFTTLIRLGGRQAAHTLAARAT